MANFTIHIIRTLVLFSMANATLSIPQENILPLSTFGYQQPIPYNSGCPDSYGYENYFPQTSYENPQYCYGQNNNYNQQHYYGQNNNCSQPYYYDPNNIFSQQVPNIGTMPIGMAQKYPNTNNNFCTPQSPANYGIYSNPMQMSMQGAASLQNNPQYSPMNINSAYQNNCQMMNRLMRPHMNSLPNNSMGLDPLSMNMDTSILPNLCSKLAFVDKMNSLSSPLLAGNSMMGNNMMGSNLTGLPASPLLDYHLMKKMRRRGYLISSVSPKIDSGLINPSSSYNRMSKCIDKLMKKKYGDMIMRDTTGNPMRCSLPYGRHISKVYLLCKCNSTPRGLENCSCKKTR